MKEVRADVIDLPSGGQVVLRLLIGDQGEARFSVEGQALTLDELVLRLLIGDQGEARFSVEGQALTLDELIALVGRLRDAVRDLRRQGLVR